MKNRFLSLVSESSSKPMIGSTKAFSREFPMPRKQTKKFSVEKSTAKYSKIFQYLTYGEPKEVDIPKNSTIGKTQPLRNSNQLGNRNTQKIPFSYPKPSKN